MTTIAEKLTLLNSTKTAIAEAIEAKGVTVGSIPFADYPGKIAEISGGGEGWVRPADWLPLPEVLATEQKFVGLYAVDDDDSNYVAILAEGAYTVDWGDGTVENFASGVMAEHKYTYASLPAGTVSSRGYKQVVVTLTPQAGQNLTLLNLNQRPVGFGAVQRTLQWLDVTISAPNATSLTVAGSSTNARLSVMEQCAVLSVGAVTDLSYMFQSCYSLQSVPLFSTSAVTNMSYMFNNCYSMQSVPLFDTSSVTDMSGMFQSCYSIKYVPLFNTPAVTSMNSIFRVCYSLQYVPLFDTFAVTDMTSAFQNCFSLQTVPFLEMSSVVNTSFLFSNCPSLARSQITGTKVSISYQNCNLSASAINEVFTNLATVTGQTITITGNPGAAACDRTIATAKGWTVTG